MLQGLLAPVGAPHDGEHHQRSQQDRHDHRDDGQLQRPLVVGGVEADDELSSNEQGQDDPGGDDAGAAGSRERVDGFVEDLTQLVHRSPLSGLKVRVCPGTK